MTRSAWILALAAGASLGWGAQVVHERLALAAGPVGWRSVPGQVPVHLAALSGPAARPGQGWGLASYGSLVADAEAPRGLQVAGTLPEGGVVELRLEGEPAGAMLLLSAAGSASVLVPERGLRDPLRPLPPRPALDCDGVLEPVGPGPFSATLAVQGDRLRVRLGDQQVHCAARLRPGRALVRAGLRSIRLQRLAVDGVEVHAPGPAWALRVGAALLGALLLGLLAGLGSRPRLVLWSAPLLAVAPLAGADLDAFFQAARLRADGPLWWALGVPLVVSLGGLGLSLLGAWWRRQRDCGRVGWLLRGGVGSVVVGVVVGLLALAVGPRSAWAALYLGVAGALLAGVLWANVNAARLWGFNLWSLLGLLTALYWIEAAAAWTSTGASWAGISSRGHGPPTAPATEAWSSFEALEHTRRYRDYPDQDYPIRPPPRDAPVRVIALGSSSTAGAYQNDDISQFWPADLQRKLAPGVQVVNQGVGGWTSFHVRRYLQQAADTLDADIYVLYMGHNDVLTRSARPYSQLFAAWQRGDDPSLRASAWLGRSRLYLGLRFFVDALAGRQRGRAVPDGDARANVSAIIDAARAHDARVLLALEALSPDPSPMEGYGRMLRSLAEQPDVAYVDAAAALADPNAGALFLDDCHLSRAGHVRLADVLARALRDQGWVR